MALVGLATMARVEERTADRVAQLTTALGGLAMQDQEDLNTMVRADLNTTDQADRHTMDPGDPPTTARVDLHTVARADPVTMDQEALVTRGQAERVKNAQAFASNLVQQRSGIWP